MEKLLKLDRPAAERFYALYREQFNPDLTVPDSVVEEWISVGTVRAARKNHRQAATRSSIGRLPKEPDADHQSKRREPDGCAQGEPQTQTDRTSNLSNVARQDLTPTTTILVPGEFER